MPRLRPLGHPGVTGALSLLFAACGSGGAAPSLPATASASSRIQVIQRQPLSQTLRFPLLTLSAGANGIALGADSNYWVTEGAVGKVARVTDTGTVTEFSFVLSHAPSFVTAAGAAGYAVATVDSKDAIVAEVSTAGAMREIKLPAGSAPQQAVLDQSGNIWIAESAAGAIAKITSNKLKATYPLPAGASPYSVALGPDHNIWITEPGIGSVAKLVPATAAVTQYALPPGRTPTAISNGGGSYLDFGESTPSGATYLARITTAGALTEYATSANTIPEFLIGVGPSSNPWFCSNDGELAYATIGKLKATYTNVELLGSVVPIIKGNDGNIWFPDSVNDSADVYVVDPMTVTPTSISFTAVAQTQAFSVTEAHHTGSFYASSSNPNVTSVSPASGTSFTVTALSAGTASVTISDTPSYPKIGNGTSISIVVTLTSISIN